MRKCITFFLALLMFSFNNYASDGNKKVNENMSLSKYSLNLFDNNSFNSLYTEYDLSLMNLQVDVMGLLFFGPLVSLDFQFANIIAVGPYVRWNYAGLMYQGIVTEWFTDGSTASPASYGIGGQVKVLIPIGSGRHRPYAGVGFEKFKGKDTYVDPDYDDHIWEYKSNIFHFDLGYRLITDGSFNFSVGVSFGVSNETENIDYYEGGEIDYNFLNTRFIGMVQIGLGWQLGK